MWGRHPHCTARLAVPHLQLRFAAFISQLLWGCHHSLPQPHISPAPHCCTPTSSQPHSPSCHALLCCCPTTDCSSPCSPHRAQHVPTCQPRFAAHKRPILTLRLLSPQPPGLLPQTHSCLPAPQHQQVTVETVINSLPPAPQTDPVRPPTFWACL